MPCSSFQDPTNYPTDQDDRDLSDQSTTPEDLKSDQRKILLSEPEAQTSRKTLNEKSHSICLDKTSTTCSGSIETSSAIEATRLSDSKRNGEVMQESAGKGSPSRRNSREGDIPTMLVSDKNRVSRAYNPATKLDDKIYSSEPQQALPAENLTCGEHHTSSGKYWAFTGVQFPGSCATLITLIPTLHLPISEENLARQINDKANYVHEKHNIKLMFILELESTITTSGRHSNANNKHRPLRAFREAAYGSPTDLLASKPHLSRRNNFQLRGESGSYEGSPHHQE